jgi:hypothetical protein
VVELDAVLPCTVLLPEIGVDEAVWDGGRFIAFRSFLIIVIGYVFDGCFRSEARIGFGMGVQPIDRAALTRGPVVAYEHQVFHTLIALSGIRHDFSGIGACELHAVDSFSPQSVR